MALQLEAVLFGGEANGFSVKLDDFYPTVTVFRNGGAPFVVPGVVASSDEPGAVRFGVYELARPAGPDTPVYVAV